MAQKILFSRLHGDWHNLPYIVFYAMPGLDAQEFLKNLGYEIVIYRCLFCRKIISNLC